MVSQKSVAQQLKKIGFNPSGWGKAEVRELQHILLDHEEIYEAVNGAYDGGFALLLATNVRLLLVDKKPLSYLTVEDMRFDMINELDYSHRLIGATINVSAGNKNLVFRSTNKDRLRRAIGHVQRCMAESKKQQSDHAVDQKEHLSQINKQLQDFLITQYKQQESLRQQLAAVQAGKKSAEDVHIEEIKPSPELSDYLFAQSLLAQAREKSEQLPEPEAAGELPAESSAPDDAPVLQPTVTLPPAPTPEPPASSPDMFELYADGMREIFGKHKVSPPAAAAEPKPAKLDLNPRHIAIAKLPLALRNRKFGRPSFHAHSQAEPLREAPTGGAH